MRTRGRHRSPWWTGSQAARVAFEDDVDPRWTRLERVVFSVVRPGGSPLTALPGLVATLAFVGAMAWATGATVQEEHALASRGQYAATQVQRVNEGVRGGPRPAGGRGRRGPRAARAPRRVQALAAPALRLNARRAWPTAAANAAVSRR